MSFLRRSDTILEAVRIAALAVIIALFWCMIYNRWTAASWQTPLAYIEDAHKGDVLGAFTAIKVAKEGNYPLFGFKFVPELGAPFEANWNDWPSTEDLLVVFTGYVARLIGVFAALNFSVLLAHVLAGISFYVACRLLKGSWEWAFAGAIAFALSRYAFAHAQHHITVLYYWHIPLCLVVCQWVLEPEGFDFKSRRFQFALLVAFITGVQNVYYTNLFAQFVLFAGIIQWMRKGWRAALPAAAVIACAAAAFFLMNADSIGYRMVHGPNGGAVERPYKWVELAALKLVDMLVPPPDHSFAPFAEWGTAHQAAIVLPPGEWPPTGYIGLVAIATLAWLSVSSFIRVVRQPGAPLAIEAWQLIWIVIYASVGGLNGFMGTLGFCLFRGGTRYSIFVLAILLMWAVRRLSEVRFSHPATAPIAAACVALVAMFDQTPPRMTDRQVRDLAQAVDLDRQFTREMEARLPKGAMVFQIPIMDFPESPAPGVPSYHHFRPFIYSEHLRFSFGSHKGRPREKWQQELTQVDVSQVVQRLESYGFAAVFINKNGFPDKADTLVQAFAAAGRAEKIDSAHGQFCCVFLRPSAQPVLP